LAAALPGGTDTLAAPVVDRVDLDDAIAEFPSTPEHDSPTERWLQLPLRGDAFDKREEWDRLRAAVRGWDGDEDVLPRPPIKGTVTTASTSISMLLSNPGGGMIPSSTAGRPRTGSKDRLDVHLRYVQAGLVDLAIMTEAHIRATDTSTIRGYIRKLTDCDVSMSPSSKMTEEKLGSTDHSLYSSSAGGIVAILSPALKTKLVGSPSVRVSGRLLHLRFDRGKGAVLNVVALYGLPAPSEPAEKAMARALHHELVALLNRLDDAKEMVVVCGDLNSVHRDMDRPGNKMQDYDTAEHSLSRALAEREGYFDLFEEKYPSQQAWTYASGGKYSRIDQVWCNLPPTSSYGIGITRDAGPFSATHRPVLARLDGVMSSMGTAPGRGAAVLSGATRAGPVQTRTSRDRGVHQRAAG